MTYKIHQIKAADKALTILKEQGLVAILGLPRTGKTRAAILTAERYGAKRVLVLTRKAAIPGWHSELAAVKSDTRFYCTNYEQIFNVPGEFDLLILDESHNFGARGKPTKRVRATRQLCYQLPLICLTGTPTVETPLGIYHQWCVTKYSPFNEYRNFYEFFGRYGLPDLIWANGRQIEQYKKAKPELEQVIEKYAVRINQDDAGIVHQAQDKLHVVCLEQRTRDMIDEITNEGVYGRFVFDTEIGQRLAVHQVEAGAVLYEEYLQMLPNTEVVDYCQRVFGDSEGVAYMTHFRSTREKFRQHFKHAQIMSSLSNAEGTDLSYLDHFVIVNTGYSGAKWVQLRERVTNMRRTTEAVVNIIVTDAGVSAEVYDAVSKKKDYNIRAFREKKRAKNTA